MALKLANNAVAILAAGLSPSDTTIALNPGAGAAFPVLGAGDWCPVTLIKSNGDVEVVHVSARSGDTLTVNRAQEGTPARTFNPGDRVEHRLTAAAMNHIVSLAQGALPLAGGVLTGDVWSYGSLSVNGTLSTGGHGVWHGGNFSPSSYMPKSGGAFTGWVSTANIDGNMAAFDTTASLQVNNGVNTWDSGMAMISFLCGASYGIKMGLRADGTFGIGGWSRGVWSWYSNPNGDMVAAGNVSAYSDPRLKEDVCPIENALAIIEQLEGVRFTWNNRTALIGRPGQRDIGVLADQVEAVLPEIVGRSVPDDENGGEQWQIVAYDKLVPVLIEAVKTLSGRVRALEAG